MRFESQLSRMYRRVFNRIELEDISTAGQNGDVGEVDNLC